jgi:tripartite-type tricarboxylate transporter receptor subunit TctC
VSYRRERLARIAVLASTSCCLLASCQHPESPWPNRPLRIEVGYAAGVNADGLAQVVAHEMSQALRVDVSVTANHVGRVGLLATNVVAGAPRDGYTLLLTSGAAVMLPPLLDPEASYEPGSGLCPVALVAETPEVLLVPSTASATSLDDVIHAARSEPEQWSYASLGRGSLESALGELLGREEGVELTEVAYRTSAMAIEDVLNGEVSMMFAPLPSVMPAVHAGHLRALAVSSAERVSELPDTPTLAELGLPHLTFSSWYGLFSPCGLDSQVEGNLVTAAREAVGKSDVAAVLRAAANPRPVVGEDFGRFLEAEHAKWMNAPELRLMGEGALSLNARTGR